MRLGKDIEDAMNWVGKFKKGEKDLEVIVTDYFKVGK